MGAGALHNIRWFDCVFCLTMFLFPMAKFINELNESSFNIEKICKLFLQKKGLHYVATNNPTSIHYATAKNHVDCVHHVVGTRCWSCIGGEGEFHWNQ